MSSARHAKAGPLEVHSAGSGSTLMGALKMASRLVPKQLNDEISLAKAELKRKGIALGIASAFFAVALIFLALLVVALVVAAIMGLATIMPAWLAALLVGAFFLIVLLIAGLIGALRLKKALPLKPEQAITGLRYDVGVVKEGAKFNTSTLVAKPLTKAEAKAKKAEKTAKSKRAKAEKEAKAALNGPAPTEHELSQRTAARREHLLGLRATIMAHADVRKDARTLIHKAKITADDAARDARRGLADLSGSAAAQTARDRWVPVGVFLVSVTILLIFLRKLIRK
ncbi:MAG: phage holin family protein [Actinomycetota bacterium]|uniref:phage holin family protein n=1 Tax=Arthrobacter sp. A5 TaxID=576926 RepID=UPI0027FF56F3|nr:phage holin family protein [Actinomycetota bacterium]